VRYAAAYRAPNSDRADLDRRDGNPAGVVVFLIVRHLLPAEQRGRGTGSLWFSGLTRGCALSATAALKLGAYTVWGILSFLGFRRKV